MRLTFVISVRRNLNFGALFREEVCLSVFLEPFLLNNVRGALAVTLSFR